MRTLALTFCLAASILFSAAKAQAAGDLYTFLTLNYCSGTSGGTWYGCYAYYIYRIRNGKSRDEAFTNCLKTCRLKYIAGTPADTLCEAACTTQNGYDH